MQRLREIVGLERSLEQVSRVLCLVAERLRPPVVGAMHITCGDESEFECVNAFQRGFAQYLLPQMKFANQSAFRLANLGGRYEWTAIRIVEEHFASRESEAAYKLLVVKINSHVAVAETAEGDRYGHLNRYHSQSPCCGALHQLLEGGQEPFIEQLREALTSEGLDRIAALLNPQQVEPIYRSLFAAAVSARLQARQAVIDIQDYQPKSPTTYVVVPCVTLNRKDRDREIVCGFYTLDHRFEKRSEEYFGLGDNPAAYRIGRENDRIQLRDDHVGEPRQARDHRKLVLLEWRRRRRDPPPTDEQFAMVRKAVNENKHRHQRYVKPLLKTLLLTLAQTTPVPAAVVLFAEGAAGIHHAYRAHRLAGELADSTEARKILEEIHDKVDSLDTDHARALIELLMNEYR